MTCDFSYLAGDTNIFAILIIGFILGTLFITIVFQVQDWSKTLYLANYAHLYLNGRLKYSENIFPDKLINKLFFWFSKIMLFNCITVLFLYAFLLIFISTLIAILDPNSNYSYILSIFWIIFQLIAYLQFYVVFILSMMLFLLTILNLYFKFTEIFDKIRICVEQKKKSFLNYNLIYLIEEHNYFTKITADINNFFRHFILLVYFLGIPVISLCVYSVHHKQTGIKSKFVGFGIATCIYIVPMLGLSIIVINAARQPFKLIVKLLARNGMLHPRRRRVMVDLRTRLKLMKFIERLTGSDIGFYCYDLFPMNSNEFYEMIAISVSNYLLLITLI